MTRACGHYDSLSGHTFSILLGILFYKQVLDVHGTDCCFLQKGQKDREAMKKSRTRFACEANASSCFVCKAEPGSC